MIGARIRTLREQAGFSQAELARRLSVTRSSVNAWESGLSAPTAASLVDLARLFRVSADYLLGLEPARTLDLSGLSEEEIAILNGLVQYFEKK